VALIIGFALYRGDPVLTTLEFALVLTVAAIPVAMPTVLSVTMAVGARLLAKKQAVVSRLVAIEELAGVDVLCADKTGTLTQDKLTLGDPFCVQGMTAEQVILDAALASRADNDDTIDLAVIKGVKDQDALKTYHIEHFTPFDPVHKRTEGDVKDKAGKSFKVTKGAPQVILALAANAGQVKDAVDKAVDGFAARGFRSLGVARAEGTGPWQLVGVLPLFDPPRDDAKATIATAMAMGVRVKMVTGDAIAIAKETCKTLGMGANILDAGRLGDAKQVETPATAELIENADGFAQVFPENKYDIIDVLQKHGHIVGMTGDGVNDAPALKKADCGIAVSTATDAARAAAAIVLMTPGLSVIIDGIKESRKIFQRMNSYSMYRIAETLRVLLFMTLAILIFNFYPVTAIMIVMIALLNDGAILSIAYDNVNYSDKPEAWNMRLVLGISTVLGVIGTVAIFGLFWLSLRVFHLDHAHTQTMMYLKMSVAGHLTIFLTRTRGPFWSIRPARILLIAVFGTQAVATLIAVYGVLMTPIGWEYAGIVWGYAVVWFFVNDRVKLLAYRIFDSPKAAAAAKAKGTAARAEAAAKPDPKEAKAKPNEKPDPRGDAKPDSTPAPANAAKAGAAPDAKAAAKPDAKPAPAPDAKAEAKPDAKADATPDAKPAPTPEAKDEAKPDAKAEAKPDSTPAPAPAPAAKADAAPDAKAAAKPDAKPAPAPDAKAEAKPDAKADATPDAKPAPTPEAKDEAKPDAKAEAKPDSTPAPAPAPAAKADAAPDAKAAAKPDAKPAPAPDAKAQAKPDAKPAPAADANSKAPNDPTQKLVERVHALYEELGREDVVAVQELERAQKASKKEPVP
jgi:H+-transporting ATPase